MAGVLERTVSLGGHVTHAEAEIASVKQLVLALNTKVDAILAHHAIKIQPQQQPQAKSKLTTSQSLNAGNSSTQRLTECVPEYKSKIFIYTSARN